MQLCLAWGFLRSLALSTGGHFRAKASLYFAAVASTAEPLVLFQVAIELVSGTARLFSLSFRLFANIMAGHSILLQVSLMASSALFHCVQSTMLLVTWAMEAGLALLQAYVFGALELSVDARSIVLCGMPCGSRCGLVVLLSLSLAGVAGNSQALTHGSLSSWVRKLPR